MESEETPQSLVRRLLANPIRLRRQTRTLLVIAALLAGAAHLVDGWPGGFLTALVWISVLPISVGMAAGDAFLIAHGRGKRRLILTILGAILVALASCVLLAGISEDSPNTGHDIISSVGYAVFFAANVLGLSALIALGIGRGGDYLSRRINVMSDDDW